MVVEPTAGSKERKDCSETTGIAGRLERYCRRVEASFGHLTPAPAVCLP